MEGYCKDTDWDGSKMYLHAKPFHLLGMIPLVWEGVRGFTPLSSLVRAIFVVPDFGKDPAGSHILLEYLTRLHRQEAADIKKWVASLEGQALEGTASEKKKKEYLFRFFLMNPGLLSDLW
jgi:hypothetical protein